MLQAYVDILVERVRNGINGFFGENVQVIGEELAAWYLDHTQELHFIDYYNGLVLDQRIHQDSLDFWEFGHRWNTLRGVSQDSPCLDDWENNWQDIRHGIQNDELAEVYANHFESGEVRRGEEVSDRRFPVLFTKLVHCLCPDRYAPVDRRVKEFFGLAKLDTLIAFDVLSNAFVQCVDELGEMLGNLRGVVVHIDEENRLRIDDYDNGVSDVRLLDMLFWYRGQPEQG